jgi:hypothetical protein
MKIYVELNDETIRRAASIVMKHYADSEFLLSVAKQEKFNHTLLSPKEISKILPETMRTMTVTIVPYKSFNPFSAAIGYAELNKIFVNTRKLDLSLMDRVQNLYHESCHIVGFTHKGNRPNIYNLNTVPYKAANLFMRYVRDIYG